MKKKIFVVNIADLGDASQETQTVVLKQLQKNFDNFLNSNKDHETLMSAIKSACKFPIDIKVVDFDTDDLLVEEKDEVRYVPIIYKGVKK